MKKYLGVKMIEAEPMTLGDYNLFRGWQIPDNEDPTREGHRVVYPDGYISWSPKEAFEQAYFEFNGEKCVTQVDVDNFISEIDVDEWKDKTTVVHVTLKNGFTITESSSCVDPANYDLNIGRDICVEKIKDKIWNHLGFLLQCGMFGFKRE